MPGKVFHNVLVEHLQRDGVGRRRTGMEHLLMLSACMSGSVFYIASWLICNDLLQ